MFKSIRRNSRQLLESRRKSAVTNQGLIDSNDALSTSSTTPPITFFSLPAELRNVIYEDIASSTRITIPPPPTKSTKSPPRYPIPSLLLVSRQTRHEFLPLLLSISPITATVKHFDFSNLTRLISSLYATELRSLRRNPDLHILLQLDKPRSESIAALRRWLVHRADGLDRIPFNYDVVWTESKQIIPTSTQVHRINVYIQRRGLLQSNLLALRDLAAQMDEMLQFELLPVVEALEKEPRLVPQAAEGSGLVEGPRGAVYWVGGRGRG